MTSPRDLNEELGIGPDPHDVDADAASAAAAERIASEGRLEIVRLPDALRTPDAPDEQ